MFVLFCPHVILFDWLAGINDWFQLKFLHKADLFSYCHCNLIVNTFVFFIFVFLFCFLIAKYWMIYKKLSALECWSYSPIQICKEKKWKMAINLKQKRWILFTISGKMGTMGNLLGQQNPLKRQRHRKGRQVWIKMNVKSWRKNWQDKSDMCAKWNFYPSRERAHKTWVYLFYRCSYFRIALIFFASAFSLFNLCYWCSVLKK